MITATAPISNTRPILLAEGDPGDEEMFRGALRRTGCSGTLHAVHNGEEAIGYLRGDGRYANRAVFPLPQLLVLDPRVPGKSGWDVLQWLRERPEFASLVVVMFGGSGTLAEEDMAYRLGVNHYHLRPQSADEFTKAVKRIADIWLARNLNH
jgi:CheY-like chemotaxis protein